ncbi:MAG: acetolactate synthase large subunit [Blastocatellia bacterium]|nr:acetolactate synthase large subunit [Blastocatellia bacterium]
MNGAESLLKTAVAAGVEVCFANPGTTEMPLVAAFDAVPGVRAVLGLFEGVCTGAADGYGRMAGRPALTLLHLGPGFANGIANLHNARRARTPIVNLIGDQATWHLAADAPLTSDIVSLAGPVSGWVRTNRSAEELAADAADAIAAAASGQVATLIVPHDNQAGPAGGVTAPRPAASPPAAGEETIRRVAESLKRDQPAVLFMGGRALGERGLRAAARVAAVSGCALVCETFPARLERGAGLPAISRLPYFPEQGMAALSKFQTIILAGTRAPVAFFGYEGMPGSLISRDQNVEALASPEEDVPATLEALADALGAGADAGEVSPATRPQRPQGALSLENLAAAIAYVQPEGAIIMDEGNTSSMAYFPMSAGAPPHSYLTLTGGAIGQGMPCATGAAIACPDRKVINLQADGSAMYTLQSLWTQAREGLDVTTLICANNSYRILGIELMRSGVKEAGPQARGLIGLAPPRLDWVQMSKGMGVPAVRVETAESLVEELERAIANSGPHLIEIVL